MRNLCKPNNFSYLIVSINVEQILNNSPILKDKFLWVLGKVLTKELKLSSWSCIVVILPPIWLIQYITFDCSWHHYKPVSLTLLQFVKCGCSLELLLDSNWTVLLFLRTSSWGTWKRPWGEIVLLLVCNLVAVTEAFSYLIKKRNEGN